MTIDTAAYSAMAVSNIARFGVTVTYKRRTSSLFNSTTLKNTEGYSSTSVTAIRGQTSSEHLGGEKKRLEKRTYQIVAADLASPPMAPDQIIDGTETWLVKDWAWRVTNLVYEARCVKAGA